MPFVVHVLGRSSDSGIYASYWSTADLGHAVAHAIEHAELNIGLEDVRATSAQYAEFESGHPEKAHATSTPGLWSFNELHSWDLSVEPMPGFWFPTGVLPSVTDEGTDPETIGEAFHRDAGGDFLQVVVDERRLWEVFLALFEGLPARDGFEIRLMDHWLGGGHTEVWIGHPRYKDSAIADYLSGNAHALLHNGGVAISVYARDAKCTLRITEHKLITLYSPVDEQVRWSIEQLLQLGFRELNRMPSIAVECGHYHFAPPGAPTYADLQDRLRHDDFRLVETIPRDDEE